MNVFIFASFFSIDVLNLYMTDLIFFNYSCLLTNCDHLKTPQKTKIEIGYETQKAFVHNNTIIHYTHTIKNTNTFLFIHCKN